ncbi:MAG TPA: hypothetical protein VHO50_07060 [Bacteroidales bacterium]|nr:hypothetical protein [Bacteroidales bacterium]
MKTKSEIISRFAETLNNNCQTPEEVTSIIDSIETMMNFFLSAKQIQMSLLINLLDIKEMASKHCGEIGLRAQEDAVDLITRTIAQANCLEKENELLFQILDCFNYQPPVAVKVYYQ